MKRTQMKPRRRSTGPSAEVVAAVYERAQYACEVCGLPVGDRRGEDHHVHHRRPRQMGGSARTDTNSPVNLLLLDPSCHGRIESERDAAYAGGWLVLQNADPATVPVLIHATRWVLLTADGRYEDVPNG